MPDGTILQLRPGILPETSEDARPEVIKELEELLAKAKAGEIRGIAYVAIHPGDLTSFARVGRNTRGMLGANMLLQHEMCARTMEDC